MAVTQYTKMIDNNGELQYIEEDRIQRFLGEGWQLADQPKPEKKSGDITVGDKTWTEEELNSEPCINCDDEDHSYMECDEDNWTFSEDDFKTAKKEN